MRDRHGLLLVVGDDHEGQPQPRLQVHQFELGFLAQLPIERRHGLVEEQNLRALSERTGQRHALTLAPRELVRPPATETFELDERQHFVDPRRNGGLGETILAQPECDVPGDTEMREQGIALKHHVDGPSMRRHRRDVAAVEHNAALVGHLEPGQQAQQGGLAASRRTEQGEELVAVDVEAQPIDRGDFAKVLGNVLEAHQRRGRRIRPRREAASHRNSVRSTPRPLMRTNREMIKRDFLAVMRLGDQHAEANRPLIPDNQIPENRELNREFLKISRDSGLLVRFWEPFATQIQ